jgi:hypothetical protein
MFLKKLNLSLNQQLLCIDLFQKYLLQNKNQIPELKEIIFQINLNGLKGLSDQRSEEFLQNYSVFILHSFSCLFPKLSLSKNNLIGQTKTNFNLKIVLGNKNDIETFINELFINFLEKQEDLTKLKIVEGLSSFDVFLPITKILYLKDIDNKKNLNVNITFKFNKKKKSNNIFFKKTPPFWVFEVDG